MKYLQIKNVRTHDILWQLDRRKMNQTELESLVRGRPRLLWRRNNAYREHGNHQNALEFGFIHTGSEILHGGHLEHVPHVHATGS